MISELHIENIAVIKRLTVNFKNGFSVLTGETGAGKSIIIDSVNLLLGARSAKELIRNGEGSALVSACFTAMSDRTLASLAELDVFPDEDGSIYIQRTLNIDGRAQAKINGRSVPTALLREVGGILINIHGQHDNQQLLRTENHIVFLDAWAHNEGLICEYSEYYSEMVRLRRELRELTKNEREKADLTEALALKIKEIEGARLKSGEEEELVAKLERLKNSEKISRYCTEIYKTLSGGGEGGSSAIDYVKQARLALERLGSVFPDEAEALERLQSCIYELNDVAESAYSLLDGGSVDSEAEIDRIQSRLDMLSKLKRKYGDTVEAVIEYKENAQKQLDGIKNSDVKLKEIKSELSSMIKKATECAERLTARRTEYAMRLSESITDQLHYLDLEKARFSVSVNALEGENGVKRFSAYGCDEVEFLISTNPGEPCKSLSKVASGGELSRVMLALKSVLADSDGVNTIIFDEIDTGVSGKTSQKIGIKLLELGTSAQVFSITHSAQIAAMGDTHYKISKSEVDGRNETSITELKNDERVYELSRIMGGIEITDTLKNTAREMLSFASEYRSGIENKKQK